MRLAVLLALPALLLAGCQSCVDEGSSGGSANAEPNAEPKSWQTTDGGEMMRPRLFGPGMRMRGFEGGPVPPP
jgi:hypothetical protein